MQNEIMEVFPYNKLTEYFVRENHIERSTTYGIKKIKARKLLCSNRIDLMAKWIYIDYKEKDMDMHDAIELYTSHIEAFSEGLFFEPGTEEKNSIQKYLEDFDNLINEIKSNGFDETKSLIPVGKDNVLLDGSHRCAIAAYYDLSVTIICFDALMRYFDYDFFRKRLLFDSYLDRMALQYCRIVSGMYCACVWPIADNREKRELALKEIGKNGVIVYTKEVELSYIGLRNFMMQIYDGQGWLGDYFNLHAGLQDKVDNCYKKKATTLAVFFECKSLDTVLKIKKAIREIYKLENHSVHISDNDKETRDMAELLLNKNSIQHLNYSDPDMDSDTNKRLEEFKSAVVEEKLSKERFVIDASACLAIYGIRKARDLDYLTDYPDSEIFHIENIDNHDSQLKYYDIRKQDLIYNPNHYFYFNGMKYVDLSILSKMKSNRGEKKDIRDIRLINNYIKKAKKEKKENKKSFKRNKLARARRLKGQSRVKIFVYDHTIALAKRGLNVIRKWIRIS